ncbi:MAG: UvrD-helicase domain-containing protein [Bacteroidota bacterium]|nr:UvrD-helicase domain-containing protein [Bacteroidota bacterium]
MSSYLTQLNQAQKEAVTHTAGPSLIIAGAGSGKTRVLTYRIAYLMENGVDPFNILALTFTNKAAREMRERIEKIVGLEARNLWMGTFHSVFARILRIEAEKLGYPRNFTIYDADDTKSLLKSIVKEMGLNEKVYKPNMVYGRISNAKNNLITSENYFQRDDLMAADAESAKPKIAEIYRNYADRCFKAGAMDFDDLLLKTHFLFKHQLDVLNKYQHRFSFTMVDEYQDTNFCQYMIVKKLAAVNENISVVGDDAQSIYSFRGATIDNILNFQKDYPDAKVFKLEQNYRSTKTIVEAANSIIEKNKNQLKKTVFTKNPTGEKIKLIRAITDNEEGRFIAQSIFEEKMQNQLQNNHFAILYRTNAQSRSVEEALRRMNIPYKIYGGLSFYQRKEIKDLVAYLRLVENPNDEEAIKRIINYPARGIGKTTLDKLIVLANQNNLSIHGVIAEGQNFQELKSSLKKLKDFYTMMETFRIMAREKDAYDTAFYIAKSTGLLKVLREDRTVEGVSRFENIEELLNGIKTFVEDDTDDREKTLSNYLQDIALLTTLDQTSDNEDHVTLMTIHMSKGLEFPYVYVSGLEENLFPSALAIDSREELEEERRLFYVAVTRAMTKLTFSFATSRFKYGNLLPSEPSRFLDDIDHRFYSMDTKVLQQKPLPIHAKKTNSFGRSTQFSKRNPKQTPTYAIKTNKPPSIENFIPQNMNDIKKDKQVQHERFGHGIVLEVTGEGSHKKVKIRFDDFGEKTLVLRFAKLRYA